ncbi:hypothetical protein Tco_0003933 [Tanacetum coccineum]
MNEQSHYKQDKTITRQSINVKRHVFNVIGDTEKFEERDLNIGGDADIQEKNKKKAKNKQNQARSGKVQVKSKSKVIHMKKIQLEHIPSFVAQVVSLPSDETPSYYQPLLKASRLLVLRKLEHLLRPRVECVSHHECDSTAGPLDIRASSSTLS